MPVYEQKASLHTIAPHKIATSLNLQHDCEHFNCETDRTAEVVRQERRPTGTTTAAIVHLQPNQRVILNQNCLHSSAVLQHLYRKVPKPPPRASYASIVIGRTPDRRRLKDKWAQIAALTDASESEEMDEEEDNDETQAAPAEEH